MCIKHNMLKPIVSYSKKYIQRNIIYSKKL